MRSVFVLLLTLGWAVESTAQFTFPPTCSESGNTTNDYTDAQYGGKVRQLARPGAHESNTYYWRNSWNADNSYMFQIRRSLDNATWHIVLYDGNTGCYIKDLYQTVPSGFLDYRINWDRNNPKVFYARQGNNLYSYNVDTQIRTLLKSFTGLSSSSSPSLNQDGTRIMFPGRDTDQSLVNNLNSYELPNMTNRRTFPWPTECISDREDERYIGYLNYIAINCDLSGGGKGLRIYNDDGTLYADLVGNSLGHRDFSPDGQFAWFNIAQSGNPFEIHVSNINGSNDRLVYSIPIAQTGKMQNVHVSWPDNNPNFFMASIFPRPTSTVPVPYVDPFDDMIQFVKNEAGTFVPIFLARNHTYDNPPIGFWAQPLANPSADGSRVNFNTSCVNNVPGVDCIDNDTGDAAILFLEPIEPPPVTNPARPPRSPMTFR